VITKKLDELSAGEALEQRSPLQRLDLGMPGKRLTTPL